MPKWVDEKILQKYWVENCKKYSIRGLQIIKSKFNPTFDQYPDVYCLLEDGNEVPAEIEWKTSDFNHDISVLKEDNGFIIVFEQNQNFELEQIIIKRKDFENWFSKNSNRILSESLKEVVKEISERKFPKLWFYYLNKSANIHFYEEIEKQTWGVPKNFRQLNRFRDIKKEDLIAFIGPWYPLRRKGRAVTGGRVPFNKFKGKIEKIIVFRVTEGYYYNEKERWEHGSSEKWPHRFKFSKKPIFELKDIGISKLSYSTKANLHKLTNVIFWDGSPSSLVDLISHGKHKF
ncbi:hypothetical protein KJA16_00680 [Patescibacteria group bacterium]|nr:hypothetical protein [Patescibacteria group bacterium]MBZ9578229.1 hypothetical protein [Patescibacteria group bacterium]